MILQPFLCAGMTLIRFFLFSAFLLGFVGFSSVAQAAFLFCNKTGVVIEAAFGHRDEATWISEGWWQIQPGQCSRVYHKPLSQRFYFYYARALDDSSQGDKEPMVWAGKYAFCVDAKAFRVEGDNCEAQHYQTKGFQEVDVGLRQKDYTLTFHGQDGQ